MKHLDETGIGTSEQRRTRRAPAHGRVKLTVLTTELEGLADNVSSTGIQLFTDGDLRVTLEIEENGIVRTVTGRLVRAQRMRGTDMGWAVELDPE
jgi:hypothetical protein